MGAASGPDLFWQLFVLPAGSTRWSLVTPPDVPTNGALILAGAGAQTLTAGIRPALALRFSPVASTRDGGRTWASGQPVTGLADVPDALAVAPRGQMIALTSGGQASLAAAEAAAWTPLTSQRSLAAVSAAAGCGPVTLTAIAYGPSGTPMLAGDCARSGAVGIFTYADGTWHAPTLVLPASLRGHSIRVLRLTRTGARDTALLQAGSGAAAALITAWTTDDGAGWTTSAPLGLAGPDVLSASFSDSGSAALVLSGNRAETITGTGWQALPAPPAGRTVTLALPAAGGTDALTADGSTLTAWHLNPGAATWTRTQVTKVPIQYGSSG